jgi:curved DNA-binding protein CbpA
LNSLFNSALIVTTALAVNFTGSNVHKNKKTMYEILEVLPNASDSEIQAAHQRLSQKLQSARNDINREDIDYKLRVINVAFNTLSIKRTRDAYDARLAGSNAPVNAAASLSMVPITPSEASSLRNETMSLKAEAMSLKAEAVSLRAEVMALKVDTGYQSPAETVLEKSSRLLSPVKKALTIVGSLIAIGMVIQLMFMLMVNRQAGQVVGEATKADEKVMLQDYYQRTGVRVGSKAEMDLLEAANRREEIEQRAIQEQERAKQEQERKYQEFVRESRQQGERVSENLRIAEEKARYEEEQNRRQLEEEKRRKEEAENQRIEREKEKWRSVLHY